MAKITVETYNLSRSEVELMLETASTIKTGGFGELRLVFKDGSLLYAVPSPMMRLGAEGKTQASQQEEKLWVGSTADTNTR